MDEILSRYCPRIDFESYEDFYANYACNVPANFNFAYDVVDEWARLQPGKKALVWTNDAEEVKIWTFSEIKRLSDKAANALLSFGIKKGDVVKLILKQRPEVWVLMAALPDCGGLKQRAVIGNHVPGGFIDFSQEIEKASGAFTRPTGEPRPSL
jgi:acetyl-CoA synthetase